MQEKSTQSQPQSSPAARRVTGAMELLFGAIFLEIGLVETLPESPLHAIGYTLVGLAFCVTGLWMLVTKKNVARRKNTFGRRGRQESIQELMKTVEEQSGWDQTGADGPSDPGEE